MNAPLRIRGLVSAPYNIPRSFSMGFGPRNMSGNGRTDPPTNAAELLAEMADGLADFKERHDSRLGEIENALDSLNTAQASMRIGGAGDPAMASAAKRRQAVSALGKFGITGKPEDLIHGLSVNAAMSTDNDPSGGYLAPDELSDELIRVQRDMSVMRRLARVVTTRSGSFKQPINKGGMSSGWVGEKSSRPETDPFELALAEIPAGEIYCNPAVTQQLLDDNAFALGEYLVTEIGDEFTEQEGAAFITGNGINKPRGFLTYPIVSTADATRAFGELQYTPSGVAATIYDSTHNGRDALTDLVYSLKAKYRQNASWLMNSATAAVVMKLKTIGDTENYLWQPSTIVGQPDRLLGYPVEIDEDMDAIGANAHPIAFGDFRRGYLITDRTGVRILRDPFTNKPYVHFYSTKRVGGGLVDSNAIKLLKCATS